MIAAAKILLIKTRHSYPQLTPLGDNLHVCSMLSYHSRQWASLASRRPRLTTKLTAQDTEKSQIRKSVHPEP
jgi:hypothetical protein